jgi:hypothetical protein
MGPYTFAFFPLKPFVVERKDPSNHNFLFFPLCNQIFHVSQHMDIPLEKPLEVLTKHPHPFTFQDSISILSSLGCYTSLRV